VSRKFSGSPALSTTFAGAWLALAHTKQFRCQLVEYISAQVTYLGRLLMFISTALSMTYKITVRTTGAVYISSKNFLLRGNPVVPGMRGDHSRSSTNLPPVLHRHVNAPDVAPKQC
jgi:hypothetical protein